MKHLTATERVAALLTALTNTGARTLDAIDTTLDVYAYAAHCGSKGDVGTVEGRRAAGRRADGYRLLRQLLRELRRATTVGVTTKPSSCATENCSNGPLGGPGDGERLCASCVRADRERARREAVG